MAMDLMAAKKMVAKQKMAVKPVSGGKQLMAQQKKAAMPMGKTPAFKKGGMVKGKKC